MHVQAFESFQWLWKPPARAALESSQELARKSLNVRNHALTNAGKHISPNRALLYGVLAESKRETGKGKANLRFYGIAVFHRFYNGFVASIWQNIAKTISQERSHNIKTPDCAPKPQCT